MRAVKWRNLCLTYMPPTGDKFRSMHAVATAQQCTILSHCEGHQIVQVLTLDRFSHVELLIMPAVGECYY